MRTENARMQNQPNKKIPGDIKANLEKNRQQGLLFEALKDILGKEKCEHTREKFIPPNIDYEGDRIRESLFFDLV